MLEHLLLLKKQISLFEFIFKSFDTISFLEEIWVKERGCEIIYKLEE